MKRNAIYLERKRNIVQLSLSSIPLLLTDAYGTCIHLSTSNIADVTVASPVFAFRRISFIQTDDYEGILELHSAIFHSINDNSLETN